MNSLAEKIDCLRLHLMDTGGWLEINGVVKDVIYHAHKTGGVIIFKLSNDCPYELTNSLSRQKIEEIPISVAQYCALHKGDAVIMKYRVMGPACSYPPTLSLAAVVNDKVTLNTDKYDDLMFEFEPKK